MQDVDNHMDDLFRKAADNYPLKTASANWEKLEALLVKDKPISVTPVANNGLTPLWILLGLLIVTGSMSYLFQHEIPRGKTQRDMAVRESASDRVPNISNDVVASDKKAIEVSSEQEKPDKTNALLPGHSMLKAGGSYSQRTSAAISKTLKVGGIVNRKDDEEFLASIKSSSTDLVPTISTDNSTANNEQPIGFIDTTAVQKIEVKDTTTAEVTTPENKKRNNPKFYFGANAGLEFSQVKNQDKTKPGLHVGLIAGLQITDRFSIEAGLQLAQKKYFTDGKYFNPKQGSMPATMTVNSMYGSSNLVEIPVQVKYDFSKKNNTVYAAVGVSSFLMTKESNQYFALVSGQEQEINSTYKPMDDYIASMLNINVGYQHSLNKNINIRLEPFVQIPLRGMGIGSLPVTTKGIGLIITRRSK